MKLSTLPRILIIAFFLAAANNSINALPLLPGASIIGLTGNRTTTGYADILAPIFGQTTQFLFLDPQVLYDNHDYTGSLGVGYRNLNSHGILGAYVFADYNHNSNTHGFWFISPGIERLGDRVDFSANLYVPVGSERDNIESSFASHSGDYQYLHFSQHEEYDRLVKTFNSVGIGGDAEIGYRVPFLKNNTKVYAGGYYFSPKDADSIGGASARLQVPINEYMSLSVSESYDNKMHNTVRGGITLSFGGRNTHFTYKNNDLSQRMLDPIQRNLASVASGWATAQPIEHSKKLSHDEGVVLSNIAFFAPNGAEDGDCTYENRCVLNQGNIDYANDFNYKTFYIQSGIYGNLREGLPSLTFTDNTVLGRDLSYKKPASFADNNVPTIYFANDGAYLNGNNRFSILELIQNNVGGINNALIIAPGGNPELNDMVLVGNDSIVGSSGILVSNPNNNYMKVIINRLSINNFDRGIGILDQNTATNPQLDVLIFDSYLKANTNGINAQNISSGLLYLTLSKTQLEGFGTGAGIGIEITNTIGNLEFSVDKSSIQNFGVGNSNLNLAGNVGVYISNSQVSNNAADGILALNAAGKSKLTVINSTIANNGIGLIADNTSSQNFAIHINNSEFINNSVGIAVDELTSVFAKNSSIIGPNTPQIVVGGNGANVTIDNPIIFDGLVLNSAGTVIFQGPNASFEIPPGTGANVQCANGKCEIN
jgi:Inverse autotransporter, beta-domain